MTWQLSWLVRPVLDMPFPPSDVRRRQNQAQDPSHAVAPSGRIGEDGEDEAGTIFA